MVPGHHTVRRVLGIILHFILEHPSTLLATPASQQLPCSTVMQQQASRCTAGTLLGSDSQSVLGSGPLGLQVSLILLQFDSPDRSRFPSHP